MSKPLGLLLALAACSSSRSPGTAGEAAPGEPGAGAARPGVSLRAAVAPGGAGHIAVVDNGSDRGLSLRRDLTVERLDKGAWTRINAAGLYLRDHCDVPGDGLYEPPACVDIPAHTTFRAAPWTDHVGDAQCACDRCAPAGAGSYRFTVETCDHSAAYASDAFAVK
jgi:hypothetical protein